LGVFVSGFYQYSAITYMNTKRKHFYLRAVLSLCALLMGLFPGYAQELRFAKDSLGQVLKQARSSQKPVFLLLAVDALSPSIPAQKRQEYTRTGLDDAAVRAVLEQDFLLVKADAKTAAGRRLARRYYVHNFPTYLYLHPDGTVLHRSFGNTRDPQRYLRDIATARQLLASPDNLSALTRRYEQGEREAGFLRRYLLAKRSVGAPISPTELDDYVQVLPVKAFSNFSEVVFVLECGPLLNSRAYKLASLNQPLVDSVYRTLPLARRTAINNQIISNTRQAAVSQRSSTLAGEAALFAQRTWNSSKNTEQGYRAYQQTMLYYYQAVRDTARWLPALAAYYEYYMRTPVDSVRRRLARQQALRMETPRPYPNLAQPDSTVRIIRVESKGPDTYALDLNNGAWAMYTSGTRNKQYLTQAMHWSQRTLDVDPQAAYYDTLAHLLYRLRLYAEAEAMQQQALSLTRQQGLPTANAEEELRKMRRRTL
jgi:hypothetical protein